ncbi:MAG: hypothetical protein QXI59_02995 [Candidatus Bathyarchaeia archaeon]
MRVATLKIGMMSAWNETSGVSVHAELVGREWVRQGHDLKVFSFIEDDYHGRSLIGQDEPYVTRCFGTAQKTNYLNPIPILEGDYEIFIAQDLNMLPRHKLSSIFHMIKRKSKTIHIIHESRLSEDPTFYEHEWDRLVCFDERFREFLLKVYRPEDISLIPFPCMPWIEGDKREARVRLGLPQEKKVILIFGQKWRHLGPEEFEVLRKLSTKIPMLVLIVSEAQRVTGVGGFECIFKKEVLERDELYRYLYASDTWLYPKRSIEGAAVLSSTIHLALGSGCIPVVRDSNFLYGVEKAVLSYRDKDEFEAMILEAFSQGEVWRRAKAEAKKYVAEHDSGRVAMEFIELFKSLED